MIDTDESLCAYLAGLVDGDGSIELRRVGKYVRPRIRIALKKNGEILFKLRDEVGLGSVTRSNGSVVWTILTKQARDFVEMISEYLRVKRKHARVLLRYYDVIDRNERRKYDDETRRELEKIFIEMKRLNESKKC